MGKIILEQLNKVFRKTLNDNDLVITETTSANNIPAWDSLMHISLISAVESEFEISFSFNEAMQFDNVGDMIRLIEKKLQH